MHATSKKLRKEKKKLAELEIVTDPEKAADDAGLRYVSDEKSGYTRKRKGDDFEYFDTEEKSIRDEQRLLRIKRLAIPPAWTKV
jgi:DNA topoisomerase-1